MVATIPSSMKEAVGGGGLFGNGIFGRWLLVFHTMIRRNIAIVEAQTLSQNLFDYAPKSNGAKDYKNLIDEIYERLKPDIEDGLVAWRTWLLFDYWS